MINNITQVSPGNRVDFSKIRKAQQGIRIPKFQTPAGGIYNFDDFLNAINSAQFAKNSNASTIAWTPNWTGLNGKYANVGELEASDKYKAFTDYVINNYNTDPRVMDYLKKLEQSTIQNGHQSILFNGDTLKDDWADQYRRLRNDGKYGYYHLGPEGKSETSTVISASQVPSRQSIDNDEGNEGGQPGTSLPGDHTLDDYYNFQFKPEPFLTPNPFIAGLSLAANKHQYDNEMQKKVPLLEAPYRQYITGSYKATVDAYNNAASEIQSQANRIASQTSNLEQSQATQLQGAEMAANKRLEGALKQQEGYNQDRENLLNTAYFNSEAFNRIANENRINLAADWNRRLDAKSKYQLTRNNIKSDFINKTWTDYQQWAAGEKNERDSALASYNDYLANLDMQKAMKNYQDLAADPTKSRSFAAIYQKAHNDFDSNLSNDQWHTDNKELSDLFENKDGLDQNELNKAFMDYLRTSNSDYATTFNRGFDSELNTAKNQTIIDKQRIQNQLAQIYPSFRNTYIGGWGPWDRRHLGRMYRTIYEKNGGILKMKRGSRFVDYLEHNRKAIKDQKQTTMEVSKQAERQLKTQLESLDRETLILLRSIFK